MKAVHIILCMVLWFAVSARSARMRLVINKNSVKYCSTPCTDITKELIEKVLLALHLNYLNDVQLAEIEKDKHR